MIRAPVRQLKLLARGDAVLSEWLAGSKTGSLALLCGITIILGCGSYGLSLGLPRAPTMGVYVAIKMPMLIFLTLAVNGLINGMFGVLLGSGLSFRQTMVACLLSFALFAMIVGSLSPLMIAMALDAPTAGASESGEWYRVFLLSNTALIAFAGIVANHRLLGLLIRFSGSTAAGWRTLIAWLAGNLFVGAQLSFNLRPFFGNPSLPVAFLRPNPFDGTFYESVWQMLSGSF